MSLVLSPGGRRYGGKPSPVDHRDFGVARLLRSVAPIPSSYSLEQWLGPVRDQGDEGSCTGNAGAGKVDFLLRKHSPEFTGSNIEFAPVTSAAYLYAKSRMKDGSFPADSGSYGRTVCKVLVESGICTEPEMPYVAGRYGDAPIPGQDAEAATIKTGAYHRIVTVDDMRHCIASDYVFIVGFDVRESFETKTGGTHVYAPKSNEPSLGGHETLFHSFDDSKFGGAFKVRNSWGGSWADHGDFWFPYDVAASPILSDAFVSHFGKPW